MSGGTSFCFPIQHFVPGQGVGQGQPTIARKELAHTPSQRDEAFLRLNQAIFPIDRGQGA